MSSNELPSNMGKKIADALKKQNKVRESAPDVVNEIAAQILRYVANTVNRFTARRLISDMLERGIEPLIEDVLNS